MFYNGTLTTVQNTRSYSAPPSPSASRIVPSGGGAPPPAGPPKLPKLPCKSKYGIRSTYIELITLRSEKLRPKRKKKKGSGSRISAKIYMTRRGAGKCGGHDNDDIRPGRRERDTQKAMCLRFCSKRPHPARPSYDDHHHCPRVNFTIPPKPFLMRPRRDPIAPGMQMWV